MVNLRGPHQKTLLLPLALLLRLVLLLLLVLPVLLVLPQLLPHPFLLHSDKRKSKLCCLGMNSSFQVRFPILPGKAAPEAACFGPKTRSRMSRQTARSECFKKLPARHRTLPGLAFLWRLIGPPDPNNHQAGDQSHDSACTCKAQLKR